MAAPKLPHAYPFLFVDRIVHGPDGDRAILGVTAGVRSASWPATLLLEAMAQATLALMTAQTTAAQMTAAEGAEGSDQGSEGEPDKGLLVGIDEAAFDESLIRNPPRPGDRLVSGCEVRGRFGRMAKVGAWMERDGVRVASAEMLLAGG